MVEVHANCMSCKKPIKDGEKNIVEITLGKAEMAGSEMCVQSEWTIWFGHNVCFHRLIVLDRSRLLDIPTKEQAKNLYKHAGGGP